MDENSYLTKLTFRLLEGIQRLPADVRTRHATFLQARQNADGGFPDRDAVARFVHSRQREDGGFVEIAPMKRSGTNPTAAAVGVLQILQPTGLTAEDTDRVAAFLAEMPSFEGGLRANGRAPLADLL